VCLAKSIMREIEDNAQRLRDAFNRSRAKKSKQRVLQPPDKPEGCRQGQLTRDTSTPLVKKKRPRTDMPCGATKER